MEVICRRRTTTDPLNKIKKMLKNRGAELKPKVNSLKNEEVTPKTEHKPQKRKSEASLDLPLMKRSKTTMDHRQGTLTKLMKHKWSVPFLNPVDPEAAGDYFQVIKHPMDFETIKRKLQKNKYLDDDEEFASDVRLIFSNATLYHPSNNWVHVYATKLNRLFDILWSIVNPNPTKESIIEQSNSDDQGTFKKEVGLEVQPDYSSLRAARVANLKARFAGTILRAETKTRNQVDRARIIEAEAKVNEVASQKAQEYQLNKQREKERGAARAALEQMERSITLDDNLGAMRDLEALMGHSCWVQSKSIRRKSPLERLGLFIKAEYRLGYEDDDDLFVQDIVLEDGEILD